MQKKLFCFGLGYSARNLIQRLKEQNSDWLFSGCCRTLPDKPIADVDTHIFDGKEPMASIDNILSEVTHILISIAPQDDIGDPVLHLHHAAILKLKNLKWLGYLSTTGVYGDRKGDWVDDETVPAPTSSKGRTRWDAEQDWLQLYRTHQMPVHIFRLGSIYGPERGQLSNLKAGRLQKIIKQGQYFSRIHVEDISQILTASMDRPNPGQSYNVVDDLPASSPDVIDYICDLLNRPPLPAIDINDAAISPMMRIFYSENKRVRNDRIKQELGVTLKYPSYKEGFTALVRKSP
ncbi:MAG: SDR family oxidoreductase [Emcibacter sp.]|nr:SDR family oxidoreductase [Emcibacter sp.]